MFPVRGTSGKEQCPGGGLPGTHEPGPGGWGAQGHRCLPSVNVVAPGNGPHMAPSPNNNNNTARGGVPGAVKLLYVILCTYNAYNL